MVRWAMTVIVFAVVFWVGIRLQNRVDEVFLERDLALARATAAEDRLRAICTEVARKHELAVIWLDTPQRAPGAGVVLSTLDGLMTACER